MHMQALSFSLHQLVGSIGSITNQSNAKGGSLISLGSFRFSLLKKTGLEDIFRFSLGEAQIPWKFGTKFIDATLGFNFCLLVFHWMAFRLSFESGYHPNHLCTHPGRCTYMDINKHVEHEDLCRKLSICFSVSISWVWKGKKNIYFLSNLPRTKKILERSKSEQWPSSLLIWQWNRRHPLSLPSVGLC